MRGKPEYAEAIKKAHEKFVENSVKVIVRSLFESAKGGYHEETVETTKYIPNEDGKPVVKEMVKTKTNKYTPPNTAAAIFLLTNLDLESWQNRQKQEFLQRKTMPTR